MPLTAEYSRLLPRGIQRWRTSSTICICCDNISDILTSALLPTLGSQAGNPHRLVVTITWPASADETNPMIIKDRTGASPFETCGSVQLPIALSLDFFG